MGLQGPGKVFLERSSKIQDRVSKWTEGRTIARYTQEFTNALQKCKISGKLTLLIIKKCTRGINSSISAFP